MTPHGRRRVAAGVALLVGAAVVWVRLRSREFSLPARIVTEDVIADLSAAFDRDNVAAEAPDALVRQGVVQPGEPLRGAGARRAIVAPPGARIRFRATLPAGAGLRFGAGMETTPGRRERASGVRFIVTVDGRRLYQRLVNPAAHHRDRRWFDERIDLGLDVDRPVEIVLETVAERRDRPPAGAPGWTRVRAVRDTVRDRQPAAPGTPNVLVLLVDTLRADALGVYGAEPSRTPTLDRLAAEGLVFEHAVAQSSWTLPSVASLLSGLHPRSHGAVRSQPVDDDERGRGELLSDAVTTWAEQAAHAGITTVGVSANPLVSRATNLAQGFETFVEFSWDPAGRNWTPAAAVNRTFLRWLERNRGHRFVAYLHYMEPHDPYTPPAAFRPAAPAGVRPAIAAGWVRDTADALNRKGAPPLSAAEIGHLRHLYHGEVGAWDAELAMLLDGLAAFGVRDSTLVIVTADHGEEFQEHGRLRHGSQLYQESIRVPLVIFGPGVRAGRRTDLAQGIDLFPTITALLGIATPPGLPGRNLLRGGGAGAAVSETAVGIAPAGNRIEVLSLVMAGWKLIHAPALGRFELYDLGRDPAERENRYGTAPEGDSMRQVLQRWRETVPAPPQPSGYDASFGDRLRALGYVQ